MLSGSGEGREHYSWSCQGSFSPCHGANTVAAGNNEADTESRIELGSRERGGKWERERVSHKEREWCLNSQVLISFDFICQ